MSTPRKLKKYPNRRIYDTVECRYVTLEELATFVRAGTKVEIVDSRDGTDLTRQVLLQVILEEQGRIDILPVELLHTVIRAQGTLEQAPLARFLSQALQQFQHLGDAWTRQVQGLFPGNWAGFGGPWGAGGASHPGGANAGAGARGGSGSERPPATGKMEAEEPAPAGVRMDEQPSDARAGQARAEGAPELDELRQRMEAMLGRLQKRG